MVVLESQAKGVSCPYPDKLTPLLRGGNCSNHAFDVSPCRAGPEHYLKVAKDVRIEFCKMGTEERIHGGLAHVMVSVSFWVAWTVE